MRFEIPRVLLVEGVQETLEQHFFPRFSGMNFQSVKIGIKAVNFDRCALAADLFPKPRNKEIKLLEEVLHYLEAATGLAQWDYDDFTHDDLNDVMVFRPFLTERAVERAPLHGGFRHAGVAEDEVLMN